MLPTLACLALLTASADAKPPPVVPPRVGKSETVALFDGKTLDGWEGHPQYWSVVGGEIVGKYPAPVEPNTFLLTKRSFSDFHLTAKGKLAASDIHTAISIWGKKAAVEKAKDPFAYEAGYLVIFPAPWGLHDKFGRGTLKVDVAPSKKVGKPKDWNDLELLAQGNRLRVAINGVLVIDWRDPQPDRIMEGPIGLELHGGKVAQEVRFKGLELTTFPGEKVVARWDARKVGEKLD